MCLFYVSSYYFVCFLLSTRYPKAGATNAYSTLKLLEITLTYSGPVSPQRISYSCVEYVHFMYLSFVSLPYPTVWPHEMGWLFLPHPIKFTFL